MTANPILAVGLMELGRTALSRPPMAHRCTQQGSSFQKEGEVDDEDELGYSEDWKAKSEGKLKVKEKENKSSGLGGSQKRDASSGDELAWDQETLEQEHLAYQLRQLRLQGRVADTSNQATTGNDDPQQKENPPEWGGSEAVTDTEHNVGEQTRVVVKVTKRSHKFSPDEYLFKDRGGHTRSTRKEDWKRAQDEDQSIWVYRGNKITYVSLEKVR
ncbi:hypothetical protein CIB48_g10377 [Xylaria polymorpha]|nr:hypothetical protein CIB48_g10377 [Xylaria polymorpha]